MTITVGKYTFQGPFTSNKKLKNKAGIYAIHCHRDGEYHLLDIGESARIKSRIIKHERMKCWQKHCQGTLTVAVYYTPHWSQSGRYQMQTKLREQYNPPCGKKSDGVLNFMNNTDNNN